MNWNALTDLEQLDTIKEESKQQPVALFKHSTTCSISATALDRFERKSARKEDKKGVKFYYLDLLNHRPISKAIAELFEVEHQSPQLLLIKDGKSVYDESHYGIDFEELMEKV
jgi:bacillithiol system protein YtxJ